MSHPRTYKSGAAKKKEKQKKVEAALAKTHTGVFANFYTYRSSQPETEVDVDDNVQRQSSDEPEPPLKRTKVSLLSLVHRPLRN